MIKAILAGLWACIVTLCAVYFGYAKTTPTNQTSAHAEQPVQLIKLTPITVPVIGPEGIEGYILAVLSINIDQALLKTPQPDLEAVLHDVAFRTFYGVEAVKYRKPRKTDLDEISTSLQGAMNQRLDANAVKGVLLQEFSFVSKDQARKPN